MKRECETCIKRKTPYCPNSDECMTTEDMPYYQNRIMLLEENKQLKANWNKLKEYIKETKLKEFEKSYGKRHGKTFTQAELIVCNMITSKMQELEGSDNE